MHHQPACKHTTRQEQATSHHSTARTRRIADPTRQHPSQMLTPMLATMQTGYCSCNLQPYPHLATLPISIHPPNPANYLLKGYLVPRAHPRLTPPPPRPYPRPTHTYTPAPLTSLSPVHTPWRVAASGLAMVCLSLTLITPTTIFNRHPIKNTHIRPACPPPPTHTQPPHLLESCAHSLTSCCVRAAHGVPQYGQHAVQHTLTHLADKLTKAPRCTRTTVLTWGRNRCRRRQWQQQVATKQGVGVVGRIAGWTIHAGDPLVLL